MRCELRRDSLRAACLAEAHASASARVSEGWSGRRGSNPRPTAWKAVTLPLSYSRLRARPRLAGAPARTDRHPLFLPSHRRITLAGCPVCPARTRRRANARLAARPAGPPNQGSPSHATRLRGFWWGGEGSNLRSPKAAGLQPAAIDRSATSPNNLSSQNSGPASDLADIALGPGPVSPGSSHVCGYPCLDVSLQMVTSAGGAGGGI
jgi:hypothetical protein